MKRLYLQIYLTIIATVMAFALIAGFFWRFVLSDDVPNRPRMMFAQLAESMLPEGGAPLEAQQAALERLAARRRLNVALYSAEGKRLALVGPELPTPQEWRPGWQWRFRYGPVWSLQLTDGRWLISRPPEHQRRHPAFPFFTTLAVVALAIAIAAYPATRRVTRRLERLKSSVDALGAGNLSARVAVEGRDEVAALAASFNQAAARIENLVGAHKSLLANASHELRSPLARVRMGIELLQSNARPEIREELTRNIAELDLLVDEILMASKLDTVRDLDREPVDLLALAAEECASANANLDGVGVTISGNPRLLRRMMRNLLENARRYGGGTPIDVRIERTAGERAVLSVCDRGPGVPESERDRIFEPFYRPSGTRESNGGVGLGLSLVRQIAERHGGGARCEPRTGGGSCFVVDLPEVATGS